MTGLEAHRTDDTEAELEVRLGRHLRAVRIASDLTQAELADRANVSLGAVRNLETGAGSSTSTLTKVLRALGQERWIDALAPPPEPFNPLRLLEQRHAEERRRPKGPPRVRRRRPPAP
jgi:transcriptional regulator with XRE-family HTH domain